MHVPVLFDEVLELLNIREGGCYIDGTVGGGGHAEALLERLGNEGLLLAIDRDEDALKRCSERLARFGERCRFLHGNYADMEELVSSVGVNRVDGVLLDLGVSSFQLDMAERGFSFMHDGPLDMRMDRSGGRTAADVVNEMDEDGLRRLFWEYGEERMARRVAAAIVSRREQRIFERTADLAEVIAEVKGGRRGRRKHPATQAFQALRMEVNGELDGVRRGLCAGLHLLKNGGRFAVISFHSLEDRIVKRFFAAHEGRWESLAAGGERWEGELPAMRRITRKAVSPRDEECRLNVRARSSKLRVAERVAEPYKRKRW